jgi:phosphatidylinositol glycan class V
MRYYELKQVPNFLLAAPMILLSVAALMEGRIAQALLDFVKQRFVGKHTAVSTLEPKDSHHPLQQNTLRLLPYFTLMAVLLVYAVFMMHIQVITRFFSSQPAVFWHAAHCLITGSERTRLLLLVYFLLYGLATTVTFSAFYPPA